MIKFYFFLLVGLLFVIFFTVRFVRSLEHKEGRLLAKIWEWIKNVLDAISGIG